MDPLDDETLRRAALELRERHKRFVVARLGGESARARWIDSVGAAIDALLQTPVGELLDVDRVERLLDEATSREALSHGVRPVAKSSLLMEMAQLREEGVPAAEFVSEPARRALLDLLAKKQLVPPKLLKELLTHEAVESMMRDMLQGALREFSEAVNPFFADWGLFAILKKLMPFGLGPMQKSLEAAQREFERRLEPEIRRFLQGFSRRAVRSMADYAVDRGDDPAFVKMRQELLAWTLEQPTRELLEVADDEAIALLERATFELALHVLGSERSRARRRATLDLIKAAHGSQTLDEALRVYGVTYRPDPRILAEASWPILAAALAHPAVTRFFTDLVDDFYDDVASNE